MCVCVCRYRVYTEETLRGRKSMLEILNVQEADFGEFNWTVANDLGAHSQAITFMHKSNAKHHIVLYW